MSSSTIHPASKAVGFYLPAPEGKAGQVHKSNEGKVPALFKPITIKNLTFSNRLGVSPMCQYSADDNFAATPYHLVHYGLFASRGVGSIIVEATSVSPEGPLSPHDLGIFTDAQAQALKPIVEYAHGFESTIGIQIGHGGRKANGQPLWVHLEQTVDKKAGGWPDEIVAPSAVEFRPNGNYPVPKELSTAEIKKIVQDFGSAAKRAVDAGFDFVEIHGAHGYLIHEFYSAISNKRTDEYGGLFENRIRFALEVTDAVKQAVGDDIPIFFRLSASDNDSTSKDAWVIDDTLKLVKELVAHGVDVIDTSSGGNSHNQDRRGNKQFVHLHLAKAIKQEFGDKVVVANVGGIRDPHLASQYIEEGLFDIALVGLPFLKNPGLAWEWADQLGVRINVANEYGWAFKPNIGQIIELIERSKI